MFKKILAIITAEIMFLGQIIVLVPVPARAAAANETFEQADWSGGSSGQAAVHPDNQTGWNKYASKDDNINTSVANRTFLDAETFGITDTLYDDFYGGTMDNMDLTNNPGEDSSLQLDPTLEDPFVDNLGSWVGLREKPAFLYFPVFCRVADPVSGDIYIYTFFGKGDFGRLDAVDETWEMLADLPGSIGPGASLAYPGTGDFIYAVRGGGSKKFYKYSMANNTWTELADTLYHVQTGGSIAAKEGKVFCVIGNDKKFIEYGIGADEWVDRPDIYGGWSTTYGSSLTYPGSGDYLYLSRDQYSNFCAYHITKQKWEGTGSFKPPNAPFYVKSVGYPGTGEYLYGWYYDSNRRVARYKFTGTGSGVWEELDRQIPAYGDTGILFDPGDGGTELKLLTRSTLTGSLPRFDTATLKWDVIPIAQGVSPNRHGIALTYDGTDYVYYVYSSTFRRYSISNDKWENLTNLPFSEYYGGDIVYSGGYVYALSGGSNTGFARYDPVSNLWTTLANTPANVSWGGALAAAGGYVYCLGANSHANNNFWKYDPGANTWSEVINPDVAMRDKYLPTGALDDLSVGGTYDGSAALIWYKVEIDGTGAPNTFRWSDDNGSNWDATGVAITAGVAQSLNHGVTVTFGSATGHTSDTEWYFTAFTMAPETTHHGSSLYYPGVGDYIYATRSYTENHFWRYELSTGKWIVTDESGDPAYLPVAAGYCSKWAYPGSGDYIYFATNNYYYDDQVNFVRYKFQGAGAGVWEKLPRPPIVYNIYNLAMEAVGDKVYVINEDSYHVFEYTISDGEWSKRSYDYVWDYFGTGSAVVPDGDTAYFFYGRGDKSVWKYSVSQDKWLGTINAPFYMTKGTRADYPGSGNFIYVLEGNQTPHLWKYDYVNDTWTQLADAQTNEAIDVTFEAGSQMSAGGDYIYMIAGMDSFYVPPNYSWDQYSRYSRFFLRYTISTNTWETSLDDPPSVEQLPYSLNNYDYVNGNALVYIPSENAVYSKVICSGYTAFYRYDTSLDTWSPVVSSPTGYRYGDCIYYPGTGDYIYGLNGYNKAFHRYSINDDEWEALSKPPFGSGQSTYSADMFYTGGDFLYAVDGINRIIARYHIANDDWDIPVQLPYTYCRYARYGRASRGPDGNTLYCAGYNYFYKYDIEERTWTQVTSPSSSLGWNWDEYGIQLIYSGTGDYLYTTRGRNRSQFARYNALTDVWEALASPPSAWQSGHQIVGVGLKIYALRGVGKTFWAYDTTANTWSALPDAPADVSWGATLCYPGSGIYIYATCGNRTTTFWRYNISQNQWEVLADAPVKVGSRDDPGTSLVYPGSGDYLYFAPGSNYSYYEGYGGNASMYRYSISNDEWEELEGSLQTFQGGGKLIYPGTGGYLYATKGQHRYDFSKFLSFKKGSFTSPVKIVGKSKGYDIVDWNAQEGGSIEFKVRTADDYSMSGVPAWENVPALLKGADMTNAYPAVKDKDKYIQYKLNFFADDITQPPTLDDITLNYDKYPPAQELVSSAYDTTEENNRVMKLSWTETKPAGSDLRFQLRTAADDEGSPGAWTPWLGPGGTQSFTDNYSTASDYVYEPTIEVTSGVARLKKIYETFDYTQRIILDNTAGVQTHINNVATIEIDSTNKYFWEHVKSDGGDVRFADGDGNALSYNLHAGNAQFDYNNKYAKIFLKVPSIPAGGKVYVYLKYGNAAATTTSDETVLPIWHSFAGTTVDSSKFYWSGGQTPTQDEYLTLKNDNNGWDFCFLSVETQAREVGKSFFFKFRAAGSNSTMMGWHDSGTGTYYSNLVYAIYPSGTTFYIYEDGSSRGSTGKTYLYNTWYDMKITLKAIGATYYYKLSSSDTWIELYDSDYSQESDLKGGFCPHTNNLAIDTDEWDFSKEDNPGSDFIEGLVIYLTLYEEHTTSPSLAGWEYRMNVDIDNTGGPPLTDYSANVELTPGNEGFWDKVRSDGYDIRFVDSDNTTILDYARLEWDYDNQTASCSVKIPSVETGSIKRIYLYYGKSAASDTSDYDSTHTKDFNERGYNASGVSLDGLDDKVTVSSSASLDITGNVTLEAYTKFAIDYWPDGWSHRKKLTFDNTGGTAATNVIVRFKLDKEAEMNADYSDMRFFEPDHSRKLRYRIQSSNPNFAWILLEIPLLPADSTKEIYVYYGNAGAASESDSTISDTIPTTDMIAWWKFDEGAGTTAADSSGSGNDGTIYNAAWVGGRLGTTALEFSGTPRYVRKDWTDFTLGAHTIGFWIKANSFPGTYEDVVGVVNSDTSRIHVYNRKVRWYACMGGSTFDGTTTLEPGVWYYVTCVYNGTDYARIYINGIEESSYNAGVRTLTSTMLTLAQTGGEQIDGIIDSFTMYTRALNSSEVMQLYHGEPWALTPALGSAETEPATLKWLPGFGYRRKTTLDNTGGTAYTNVIVQFDVTYVSTKMNSDFSDLRFVDTDGTILRYNISEYTADTTATVAVAIPLLPASTKDIYMYYGNANATDDSDATFGVLPIDGLVGYWNFDEGSGTTTADSSGNDNTGTLVNSPTWVAGKCGGALSFDGSSNYVEAPDSASLRVTDAFSVGFWVNKQGTPETYAAIVCKDSTDIGEGYGVYYGTSNSRVTFRGRIGGSWSNAVVATNDINIGTWTHFVATYDGSIIKLYRNGQVDNTLPASGTVRTVSRSLTIGRQGRSTLSYFNGIVDEVAIYNQALSEVEVQQLMEGATASFTPAFGAEEAQPTINRTIVGKPGAYELKFDSAGLSGLINGTDVVSTLDYNIAQLMHAAFIYDGSDAKLYIDGAEKASASLTGAINTNANSVIIGEGIEGLVDDARIWNTALIPGILSEYKDKYLYGNETGLVMYLPCNENTGTAASDLTANANNGILANGAGWIENPFSYSNGMPVALYHMDEAGGPYTDDSSGNGLNLTLDGATWPGTPADLTGFSTGTSVEFNGVTAYAYTSDNAALDTEKKVSIEAWIKPDDNLNPHVVVLKGDDTQSRWNYKLTQSGNTFVFSFYNGQAYTFAPSGVLLQAGNIYQLVATYEQEAGEVNLYLNGALVHSESETALMIPNDDNLIVGREASDQNAFDGLIDEVRIYRRALSADEVLHHYQHRQHYVNMPAEFNIYEPPQEEGVAAYVLDNPVIQPVFGVFYSNKNIAEFLAVMNEPHNTGIGFQISYNGFDWYWHNGASWAQVQAGYSETNTGSEVNTNLGDFLDSHPDGDFYYRAYMHVDPGVFMTPSLDYVQLTLQTGDTYYVDANGAADAINSLYTDAANDQWVQYKTFLYSDGDETVILDDVATDYIKAYITVTYPDGGEEFEVAEACVITWDSQAIVGATGTVKLEYSVDGGSTYDLIEDNVSDTGSYNWTVPNEGSHDCMVKITSSDFPVVTDASDAAFTILALEITSPNGGEIWERGRTHDIIWSTTGAVPNNLVKLEYSPDGGTNWTLIVNNIPTGSTGGSYEWELPSISSDSVLVRLSASGDANVSDVSDAALSIVPLPAITVSSPSEEDVWLIGTQETISWSANQLLFSDNVLLQYSTDSFGSDINDIATVSVGTPQGSNNNDDIIGSYNWTVEDAPSDKLEIRVIETEVPAGRDTQGLIAGVSDIFTIAEPTITITSPASETIWVAGDTEDITWTSVGTINPDSLTLEYSVDDGQTFTEIATDEANDGTYSWAISPGAADDAVTVRITDAVRPTVQDVSEPFLIYADPTVIVQDPNGGEQLTIGTSHDVKWTTYGHLLESGGADYGMFNIYYSSDNGETWNLIGYHQDNTGTYTWSDIPDDETATALMKIEDENNPTVIVDTSDAVFSIVPPRVTVTFPNGGEQCYATGEYEILWTSLGSVSDNLTLQYSADGGINWNGIATGEANDGTYTWTVADVDTQTAKIKIFDASRPVVSDESDSNFVIVPPTITITSPNGGEEFCVGTFQTISWTSSGYDCSAIRDNITIQYTSDGGTNWNVIPNDGLNDGTHSWQIPNDVSTNCLVKVYDATRPATTDTTDAVFTITLPYVDIQVPNGGENWPIGTTKTISWISLGAVSDNLTLEYTKDNFQTTDYITVGGANDGVHEWTIPDDLCPTVKVRITDADWTDIHDQSDVIFSIINPVLNITAPNGGELLTVGDAEDITWENTGAVGTSLTIEYSTDNFATPENTHTIDAAVSNPDGDGSTGSYEWTIPDDVSATVRVRVTDNSRPAVKDKSTTDFTILPVPVITIIAPNGGEMWRVGDEKDITWEDNGGGISNDLTIQYSTDGGQTWPAEKIIATGEANDGSYLWEGIPDNPSQNCLVKISDPHRATTVGTSDEVFIIGEPIITITAPNGGEIYAVGDRPTATWTSEGTVSDELVMQYSPDGGTTWYLLNVGVDNTGSQQWTIPDNLSVNAYFRIYDSLRPATTDDSDLPFNIIPLPTIDITSPDGGEEWVLGETNDITWIWTGLSISDNLLIEISNDSFATRQIVATGLPNTGTYNWEIAEATLTGATLKIRVTDGNRTEIQGETTGFFRIRGGFTLNTPNGGEKLTAKSSQTVSWQTRGNIQNVKIDYSTNGGVNWNTVAASVANAGTYTWTLPDIQSSNVTLRVSDPTDPTVYDESDGVFDIVYQTVEFKILDYDTLQHLSDISVSEPATGWNDTGLNSPLTRETTYPYGSYTTFITKTNYIDNSVTWSPPKTGTDTYVINVYLENTASAQVTWEAILTYSFSPANDSLTAVGSLQRKGKLVGTRAIERADMGSATFTIYEPGGEATKHTLTASLPSDTGMYNFTLLNTGFEAGLVYPATLSITYRDRPYVSAANIDVGSEILQYEFFTQTAANLAESVTAIQVAVAGGTSQTQSDIEESRTKLVGDLADTKTEIETHVTDVLSTTEEILRAKMEEVKEKTDTFMKSSILNSESVIRSGQNLTIRYRTYSGLNPNIDVYDANNAIRVNKGAMKEISNTGIYEYNLKFENAWGRGDFTIVCSEITKGTLDAMTISVLKTDVEQIYNQVASILGTTSGITGLKSVADTLNSQFSIIETALSTVGQDLVKEVKDAASSAGALESVFTQLTKVAKQIKELTGGSGINLDKLYSITVEKKQDMKYLKNKTQELKAAMEISQKMVDNIANKPVTQTWYEYR